ncbi:MAG: hypothetical protein R3F55_07270 [Alphaproteobacteria bacterium]
MIRRFALACAFTVVALPAAAQSLDGTWLLLDRPDDPLAARVTAANGSLPTAELEQQRRIAFDAGTATVIAGESVITLTIAPSRTEWGFDAPVTAIEGSAAPITFLRVEIGDGGIGSLTSFKDQTPLEQFALVRVRPAG